MNTEVRDTPLTAEQETALRRESSRAFTTALTPEDWARVWATLDAARAVASPAPDRGLDVERLRRALVAADEEMGNRYPETFPLDLTNTGWPRFAAAIAAAYEAEGSREGR